MQLDLVSIDIKKFYQVPMNNFCMLSKIFLKIKRIYFLLFLRKKYGAFGKYSIVHSPLQVECPENIYIGKGVTIQYKSWIAANPLTGYDQCELVFEDGCSIGNFNHIYATHSIVLHRDVLTADKVYISDNLHGYEDISIPIKKQPIIQKGTVEIGEGSWLGENVCVIGAKIGKHCVIGANSVVTNDIPDYSVAVGVPARVIKKYNLYENKWKKTDNGGG